VRKAHLAVASLVLAGCASSSGPLEVELGATPWKLDKQGRGEIAIAVHDQRLAVQSGAQEPTVTGESLLDPGQPAPIRTRGGDLAANVLGALEKGLRAAGYQVRRVITAHTLSEAEARAALEDAEVSLLLVVREWEATLREAMAVSYDVSLHLIEGPRGERAKGEARGQRGFDPRGESEPATYAQRCQRDTLRHALEGLFSEPALNGALPSAGD
jgi:hypothetical protein